MSAPALPDGYPHEREAAFQQAVIELAQRLGWRVAHFRAARTKDGWATPVAADGQGFPDLVLVRDRVIFAELKAENGKTTTYQNQWLAALADADAETYLWRPSEWSVIEAVLKARKASNA